MPVNKVERHTHNGSDSNRIDFSDLTGVSQAVRTIGTSAPLGAVADASGGLTVDTEARAAINAVIARLETLGLIET